MPIQILMPKLSDTMETGKLIKWLKKEGDKVSPGEAIAEAESDKATLEIEAADAGTVAKLVVAEGAQVPVGGLIALLAEKGESLEQVAASASAGGAAAAAPAPAAPATTPAAKPAAAAAAPPGPSAAAPAAAAAPAQPSAAAAPSAATRPSAAKAPAATAAATAPASRGSGDGATATAASPAPSANGRPGHLRSSPLARRLARARGVDLASVRGSGPQGRIVARDVPETPPAPPAAARGIEEGRQPARGSTRIPLSSMRKAIARRMAQAKREVPHFYLTVEVDAEPVSRLREELGAAGEKVSINDILIKASAHLLARRPEVNASFSAGPEGQADGDAIVRHGEVHVGLAVALPPREGAEAEGGGLITPVVRNADQKGLAQIARESRDLVERARSRKLKPEDYTGATFSISNLGMFGITEFAAIVNPPEAAILAVGAILEVPVVKAGAVVVGRRMRLTLSGDHRVIDGAIGAEFLRDLRALLEAPMRMLL